MRAGGAVVPGRAVLLGAAVVALSSLMCSAWLAWQVGHLAQRLADLQVQLEERPSTVEVEPLSAALEARLPGAVERRRWETVRLLVELGAGRRSLAELVQERALRGDWAALESLATEHPDLLEVDWGTGRVTPLLLACENGRIGVVRSLLGVRSSSLQVDPQGRSCWHLAALHGHPAVVQEALRAAQLVVVTMHKVDGMWEGGPLGDDDPSEDGEDQDQEEREESSEGEQDDDRDGDDDGALMAEGEVGPAGGPKSGGKGREETAKEAVNFSVSTALLSRRDLQGRTALHLVASCPPQHRHRHSVDVTQLLALQLLAHGASPHARTASGHTALHVASWSGCISVVRALLWEGSQSPDRVRAELVTRYELWTRSQQHAEPESGAPGSEHVESAFAHTSRKDPFPAGETHPSSTTTSSSSAPKAPQPTPRASASTLPPSAPADDEPVPSPPLDDAPSSSSSSSSSSSPSSSPSSTAAAADAAPAAAADSSTGGRDPTEEAAGGSHRSVGGGGRPPKDRVRTKQRGGSSSPDDPFAKTRSSQVLGSLRERAQVAATVPLEGSAAGGGTRTTPPSFVSSARHEEKPGEGSMDQETAGGGEHAVRGEVPSSSSSSSATSPGSVGAAAEGRGAMNGGSRSAAGAPAASGASHREEQQQQQQQQLTGQRKQAAPTEAHGVCSAPLECTTWQANVNARNRAGFTPVHEAVQHNQPEVLRLLLRLPGTRPCIRTTLGDAPLHLAAWSGHLLALEELLHKATSHAQESCRRLRAQVRKRKLRERREQQEEEEGQEEEKGKGKERAAGNADTESHQGGSGEELEQRQSGAGSPRDARASSASATSPPPSPTPPATPRATGLPLRGADDAEYFDSLERSVQQEMTTEEEREKEMMMIEEEVDREIEAQCRWWRELERVHGAGASSSEAAPPHHALQVKMPRWSEERVQGRVLVNQRGRHHWTALHGACWQGHLEVVQRLLRVEGIAVNAREPEHGLAPLHLAVSNQHGEVVRLLLRGTMDAGSLSSAPAAGSPVPSLARADPNAQDRKGRTALHRAVVHSDVRMVGLLLQLRAEQVLEKATTRVGSRQGSGGDDDDDDDDVAGREDAAAPGADTGPLLQVDLPDAHGCSPLHLAVQQGNLQLVRLLRAHGADSQLPDDSGMTPLQVWRSSASFQPGTEGTSVMDRLLLYPVTAEAEAEAEAEAQEEAQEEGGQQQQQQQQQAPQEKTGGEHDDKHGEDHVVGRRRRPATDSSSSSPSSDARQQRRRQRQEL